MKLPTAPRRFFARPVLLCAMTIATSLCLLAPATTSAHRAHLQSGLSSGPLQEVESTAGPTEQSSSSGTPSSPAPNAEPNGESSAETRRERHVRRGDAGVACSVSLAATPSTIAPGASVSLAGTLRCPETVSAAGQTVTLYSKVVHTSGFSILATATTETSGAFQFSTSEVEANSVFYVRCDGVKSPRTRVRVAALQVNIETPIAGTQLLVGVGHAASSGGASENALSANAVTFTGTISPADTHVGVVLQREYRKERWHQVAVGRVGDEGKYSIVHTFLRPGEANLRVVVRSQGLFAAAVSAPVTYLISRPHHRSHASE